MRADHLWNRAKYAPIRTSAGSAGNFDIGFDEKIPAETRDALEKFVVWVEDHFTLPITAITCYFAWITNGITEGYTPDADEVEEVLQAYLHDCS